jgi:DNA-binding MarR family transcriptional regulator
VTRGHGTRHQHPPVAEGDLADQLHSAAIHLLRQLRKEDDASGLSAPRLSALSVVVFGGPLTLGGLARAEQVKPPTMTRIVTGLEKDGLVNRKDDPRDGRLTHIEATAKGRKILMAGRARRVEKLASAVGRLNRSELAELRRGVQLVGDVVASMRGDRPERREAIARPPRIREEQK